MKKFCCNLDLKEKRKEMGNVCALRVETVQETGGS